MCSPQLIFAAARTVLTVMSARQDQSTAREQAIRQNAIAAQARREKVNAENLKLRQIARRKKEKIEETQIESREAQATARTAAETVGGAALDRVVNNYLRLEGRFTSTIEKNLEAEIAQSNMNKRLFNIEQEGRQTFIPEVDTVGIFTAGAIEFGGDFFEWKTRKEEKEAEQKRMDIMMRKFV